MSAKDEWTQQRNELYPDGEQATNHLEKVETAEKARRAEDQPPPPASTREAPKA